MSDYSTNLTEKQWQVINNIVKSQEKSRKNFSQRNHKRYFSSHQERMSMAYASD